MKRLTYGLSGLLLLAFTACWDSEEPAQQLELSLYTGIPGVARLGESYQQITQSAAHPFEKIDMSDEAELSKVGFVDGIHFKKIGTRVFFKRAGAGMIVVQEPFKGTVKSKGLSLFSFSVPPVSDWESLLIKELGQPEARAAGGRFASEGLFYNWGDISYNRMGPNEIALYRDPELTKFRMNNFGREIKLFPDAKK
jgi:hypothetical protein